MPAELQYTCRLILYIERGHIYEDYIQNPCRAVRGGTHAHRAVFMVCFLLCVGGAVCCFRDRRSVKCCTIHHGGNTWRRRVPVPRVPALALWHP